MLVIQKQFRDKTVGTWWLSCRSLEGPNWLQGKESGLCFGDGALQRAQEVLPGSELRYEYVRQAELQRVARKAVAKPHRSEEEA